MDSKVKPTHEQRPRPAGLLAHLEVRPIEVEVAEAGVLALGEATELPVTWAQMLLVNRLSAAYGLRPPRLRASAPPRCRFDVAVRQPAHPRRDDGRLEGVGPRHPETAGQGPQDATRPSRVNAGAPETPSI